MLSPTPTQKPPAQQSEQKKTVKMTPSRRRPGQTPLALFVKGIFRPIFKGMYYLLLGMRTHKLLTLIVIVLLLASVFVTNYVAVGSLPFGIASDPFNFHVHGTNGGGDQVKDWLYALRDGDVSTISLLDKDISQPPDPNQLVSSYSQTQAHLYWKAINVIGVYSESDTSTDSFVEVDVSANGPGGVVTGILIWHFTTAELSTGEAIIEVNLVDFRAPLQ
ncbi:MAG TPA: hypothetical protein VKV40_09840 [Ktedonobacteraceae bacterium]|nr:hypothetical protein [Ktedonobacteraceae bacterium]